MTYNHKLNDEERTTALIEALMEALRFRGFDPTKITEVEENCGTVWFRYNDDGEQYFINIDKCEPLEAK